MNSSGVSNFDYVKNSNAIKQIINTINQYISIFNPDLDCAVMSLKHGILYCSPARLKRLNLKLHPIGKTMFQIAEELGFPFPLDIRLAIEKSTNYLFDNNIVKVRFLFSGLTNGVNKIYEVTRKPIIINKDEVIFLHTVSFIESTQFLSVNYQLIAHCKESAKLIKRPFSKNSNNIQLTKREQQVLFLLALGLTSKEIANLLYKDDGSNLQPSSIHIIINRQLYPKFAVSSTSALLIKAFNNQSIENEKHQYHLAWLNDLQPLFLGLEVIKNNQFMEA